jgi:hypothetical protein
MDKGLMIMVVLLLVVMAGLAQWRDKEYEPCCPSTSDVQ